MRTALAMAALAASAPVAHAITIDGANSPFTLDFNARTVEVLDGGALIVNDGAAVTPPAQTLGNGLDGVSAVGSGTVVVNGGAINGGATSDGGQRAGTGLEVNGTGDVTISGGAITGGAVSGTGASPGRAIDIDTTGTVTITGGTLRGGAQNGRGRIRGDAGSISNARVEISSGDFEGAPGGNALGLIDVRNATITGGEFNGGDEEFGPGGDDSREGDGLFVAGDSVVDILDGVFTGGDSLVSGNFGSALSVAERSEVTIFGGTFTGGLNDAQACAGDPLLCDRGDVLSANLDGVFNLRGGVFDGTALLFQSSILNIFGLPDLMFDGTKITGTLLSGEAIDLEIAFRDPNTQVNLNVIPLPAGAWLLLSGIAAMGAARRFRRA
ncbi:MAG: VPLPA-CTERM sorting domain-containing protein [Pseudomonadota bacterium]